jgi:hypothetical protein
MGIVHPEIVAQRVEQRHVRVSLDCVGAAINPDGVLWHLAVSSFGAKP